MESDMDVDCSLINRAKNLVEEQIPEPILEIPSVPDSCSTFFSTAVD